ncbi:MAG TPA: PAS domain-containing protein, partial [Rhodocyclaceae bacterium]|nr:PAS domain-containing protein [Rhodocyclaceae bacterium]
MTPSGPRPGPGKASRGGMVTVVLAYAAFASQWILLSDKAVEVLFSDPAQITLASTLKGWVFVAVTSILLYRLMERLVRPAPVPSSPAPADGRRPGPPFLLTAVAIVALTVAAVSATLDRQRDKEVARLQAIAELKKAQIEDWLTERQGDAEFVKSSEYFAANYRRWRDGGDIASRDTLETRLAQLAVNRGFGAMLLLDQGGGRLWGTAAAESVVAPALAEGARQAVADRRVHRVGPYRGSNGTLRLDFVAPLTAAGPRPPLVVLEADPKGWMNRTLQTWPAPSASGETLLFRRDGEDVLFLNELRHRSDTAVKLRVPVASRRLLAAQVLRGEAKPGSLVEGVDYRDVPVMGVVKAISGTDWYLVVKLDRDEAYADAVGGAVWILLTGLLTLFVAGAGLRVLHQRELLLLAANAQQAQAERLHALQLLAAVADSSDDAIFAKDPEGRYLMVNQAASGVVGRPVEDVLGRDDRALFPAEQAA